MQKEINTVEEKLAFYKKILKHDKEVYLLFSGKNKIVPLCVFETKKAKSGFAECNCQLFGGFTFNKNSREQEKFMKEQGFAIIDNLAYDVHPLFNLHEMDEYLGNFEVITKPECATWLKSHQNSK